MNIFIDTEDMEERYGGQLYQDYLVEQNKNLQQIIDKTIEILEQCNVDMDSVWLCENVGYAIYTLKGEDNNV